jgi:uncharacterized Fe-S radical SAM superfamily protein PflX
MKSITKAAWNRVIEKACDVANATRTDNDPMFDVYREQMLELLDELEAEFGMQSRILDTRADYIDDPLERRRLCTRALELARAQNDQDEIEVVLQSLRDLEEDLVMEAKRNGKKTKHNRVPGSN